MATIRAWRGERLLAERTGAGEVNLLLEETLYEPGDELEFVSDTPEAWVRVDTAVAWARVYLPEGGFRYRLPLTGYNLAVYAPGAFQGDRHLLSLRPVTENDYRNLAANPADQRGPVLAYPHATANVETRDESSFCARNAIDGEHAAHRHGHWPWGSWGVGQRADACLTLDFGREVETDGMTLYLRADFPHDAYWERGVVVFSDGGELAFPLKGIDGPQRIAWDKRRIRWLRLERLEKCDNPSAFPALRQLEVWGRNA